MLAMGASICQATVDFVKIAIYGGRGKDKERLEQLLSKVAHLAEGQVPDDSDSSEEDENCPRRKEFQDRVMGLLGPDKQRSAT